MPCKRRIFEREWVLIGFFSIALKVCTLLMPLKKLRHKTNKAKLKKQEREWDEDSLGNRCGMTYWKGKEKWNWAWKLDLNERVPA